MILLDGSMGTALWNMAEEKGIEKVSVWKYNIEQPDMVLAMHRKYVEAGSNYIQTNTFSANRLNVESESSYTVEQVITSAVKLAKQAAEGTDVKVYLSSGPLSVLLQPLGKLSREECFSIYDEIASAAVKAGVDMIVFETFLDLEMMKIAVEAAKKYDVKVISSMTFGRKGRTMYGNTVKQIAEQLSELGVDGIGLNCGLGPVQAGSIIRQFREYTSLPLYFKPNSGMDENYDAIAFAQEIKEVLPYVDYVGACCGSDENYIKEIKKLCE